MKNAIFRFLTFSVAYQPLKMAAHPCAAEARINQSFLKTKDKTLPSTSPTRWPDSLSSKKAAFWQPFFFSGIGFRYTMNSHLFDAAVGCL